MIYLARIKSRDFEQEYRDSTDYRYRLDDNHEIIVPTVIAWCQKCESVETAEQVPLEQAIRDRIDRVASGELDEFLRLDDEKRKKEISYHEKVLEWRKNRDSPPQCLKCSSELITELEEPEGYSPEYPPGKTVVIFSGQNVELELFLSGHINSRGRDQAYYDSEGKKV